MVRPPFDRSAARVTLAITLILLTGARSGPPGLQEPAPAAPVPLPACTPDTTTAVRQLLVGLEAGAGLGPEEASFTNQLARQVASFVEPPARVTIDRLRGPSEWRDGPGTHRSAGLLSIGQLTISLTPEGRVGEVRLEPGTGSPEVDQTLLAAVATADSGGVLPRAAAGSPVPERSVRLWILTAEAPTTTWATPVFRVAGRVPAAATSATVVSESAPIYPAALSATGRRGDVYIAFDVDEAGQVPDASVHVLSADDSAFVAPALTAVHTAHFAPGTVGGCPVRSTVRQRFRFDPVAAGLASGAGTVSGPDAIAPPAGSTPSSVFPPARWIAESLPLRTRASVLIQVTDGAMGTGADVSGVEGGLNLLQAHTRVVRPKLSGCTLTFTQRFETEPSGPGRMVETTVTAPLDRADPGSLITQRLPPESSTRVRTLVGEAWHVVLAIKGGAVRYEYRQSGAGAAAVSSGWLDFTVPDARAGTDIVRVLSQAIRDCAPPAKP